VLDAAHMSGTRDASARHVGHDADVTVFSFHSVKNLPTADGGMICFAREEDDVRARKLSWLGIDKDTYARTEGSGAYKWRYEVDEVGFKYHGNSLMAAIGLVQLRYSTRTTATGASSRSGTTMHSTARPASPACRRATGSNRPGTSTRFASRIATHSWSR
jgi:dTDP-4-amino-4,6-dideoxygalactose transaminase